MKLLLTIGAILIWTAGQSCSCNYMGNFLKVKDNVEVIAIIKVNKYNDYFPLTGAAPPDTINQPLSATFEIVEILKGQEKRETIKVFGDHGADCRPYINTFEIDKYYVVGLIKCVDTERRFGIRETKDDYQVIVCGEYWLDYNPSSGMVTGLIKDKKKRKISLRLDDFKNLLEND
ncbi:MAG: hypothetical protein K8H85_10465 [Cyclobacteriaceae bacterium]|nr:hypothetical protein [Cyclobacteriaceae bacterium]